MMFDTEVPLMASKKNKSSAYQWKIVEIPIDPAILNDFQLVEGLGAQLSLASYSERFYELRQELMIEVLRVVDTNLTDRQAEVVTLRLQGKTQVQIAEQLDIHQTTVHKLLMGNIDYTNGKKRYGGAIKKLTKICFKDGKILEILEEMEELRAKDPLDFVGGGGRGEDDES
jgi:DNA-binding CsgD family transcriptional regulator